MTDTAGLMEQLEQSAAALDKDSTLLDQAIERFEGMVDDSGQWSPGPKPLYEQLIADKAEGIYADYEGRDERVPPEVIRDTRAERIVKREHAELWADYHQLKAEIERLQKRISSRKESISARQSVLSAEKALLMPVGRA